MHDVGAYGPERSRVLEPGMVLTVEPGLYIAPDADVPEQYRGSAFVLKMISSSPKPVTKT